MSFEKIIIINKKNAVSPCVLVVFVFDRKYRGKHRRRYSTITVESKINIFHRPEKITIRITGAFCTPFFFSLSCSSGCDLYPRGSNFGNSSAVVSPEQLINSFWKQYVVKYFTSVSVRVRTRFLVFVSNGIFIFRVVFSILDCTRIRSEFGKRVVIIVKYQRESYPVSCDSTSHTRFMT